MKDIDQMIVQLQDDNRRVMNYIESLKMNKNTKQVIQMVVMEIHDRHEQILKLLKESK